MKFVTSTLCVNHCSLPPRGGSGLKFGGCPICAAPQGSPSTRREWIEIAAARCPQTPALGLPPRGGSGLKYLIPRLVVTVICLPPRGGSGLKSRLSVQCLFRHRSPSTRREWIEIAAVFRSLSAILSPSTRREWIEISTTCSTPKSSCLPPRGGSGLKSWCCRIAL